ncbi:replicase [Qubevirus faecium]|uniref:RNA-directed RNA polymerase n=2 Tax=Qubevirus faecium TaxID=39804 RepID=C8YL80_9VIRU|nr:replicase [Qubevirus faecium]
MSKTASHKKKITQALSKVDINFEDDIHMSIANDLFEAYGIAPLASAEQCISTPFPDTSMDADAFRIHYLRSEILSKFSAHPLGIDTEAAAWEKFLAAEEGCRQTNERLTKVKYHDNSILSWGERVIHTARRKILKLIGETVPLGDVALRARFSGGATTSVNRLHGHPSWKHACPQDVTKRALKYLMAYKKACGDVVDLRVNEVRTSNKAVTVPKNSKTDRCIAIEPGWNMFFQLGVGAVLRDRLRLWQIDLNDQSVNQRLARDASQLDHLATVDLSAASDSISLRLVELLMPPAWFDLLTDLRSDQGVLPDGRVVTYEKISSMGNGYTFELESLIFAALARSVCELLDLDQSTVSVYGDDIIIDSRAADVLMAVFEYVGFTPNRKKTFIKGPFRESCGKHWHSGVDVTPFYIRRPIRCLADMILVLNSIYRWGTIDGVWDPRVLPVYQKYVKLLPRDWRRNTIPDGYGDGALVGLATTNPFVIVRNYSRWYPVLVEVQRDAKRHEFGSYLYALLRDREARYNPFLRTADGSGFDETPLATSLRRKTGRYKVAWIQDSAFIRPPYFIKGIPEVKLAS